jgi:RND family efflux transporter MFP subunit
LPAEKQLLEELRIDRTPGRRSSRRLVWLLGVPLLFILVLGLWWRMRDRETVTVRAATVREVSGAATSPVLNASGYVTARRRATVSSKITGKVVEVLVEEGKPVQEGQIICRLDDATPRVNLALAEAQLESARRAWKETEARLNVANINLRRVRSLGEAGVKSQSALDAAQADVNSLAARLEYEREQVKIAERQVAVRRQDLDDTVIRAPFSGIVTSKDAQPGEMISPVSAGGGFTRTGICTLVDMKSLEIEVDVNESYIARVQPHQRVEAVLDAYPDWKIAASVITTIPAADRQKATVKVRIAFDHLDPRILPDMGVKVAFLETKPDGSSNSRPRLLVPRTALRQEDGRQVVYVVLGDKLERRAVTVGPAEGDHVVVTTGMNAGEQVVVEGPANLAQVARVKLH